MLEKLAIALAKVIEDARIEVGKNSLRYAYEPVDAAEMLLSGSKIEK